MDDQTIADDVRVFRYIRKNEVVVKDDGTIRPKSSEFSDHREDQAMSVFLEDEILAAGRKPEELMDLWGPGYLVCFHTVKEYRELGQVIERSPISDFPGHANVTDQTGKRSGGRKTKLATGARWLERSDS